MTKEKSDTVSHLLEEVREGRAGAFDKLFELVHAELRQVARRKWPETPHGQTLQPTELVHEVYLRLIRKPDRDWKNRSHFFAIAARAMHDIIVERARKHDAAKRRAPGQRVPTYEISVSRDTPPVDILDLEDALTRLQAVDGACYDVTILRVYGELTGEETADAMRVSASTVDRKWKYAKAWLHRELSGSSQSY